MVTDTLLTNTRILAEGYGPGAWHGADLKASLDGVDVELAYWRPGAGRHNIAEIALHHAYCTRGVRARLTGVAAEPFVMDGDDWFPLCGESAMPWSKIQQTVATEHQWLTAAIEDIDGRRATSPVSETERANLSLGITCHAIYHAGQIQLIKRLKAES